MAREIALIDRDGTLFDTCFLNISAWKIAFENFKIETRDETYRLVHEGSTAGAILKSVPNVSGQMLDAVLDFRRLWFVSNLDLCRVNDVLLTHVSQTYEQLSIVTNASRQTTDALLLPFGVASSFIGIISRDDCTHGKPSAEPYLLASEKFATPDDSLTAFEDSEIGLASARAAGVAAKRVPHFCSSGLCSISAPA